MKWPNTLTIVRHGESEYNALRARKIADPLYQAFQKAYTRRKQEPALARELAQSIHDSGEFALHSGDHDTALNRTGQRQARETGQRLAELIDIPDIIFVSPYDRAHQTLEQMTRGWPALRKVRTVEEERLREQEHGLALIYHDWRIFHILHPEQEQLRDEEGAYWYRYPQGENVPDVRERLRSWLGAIARDYSERNVLAVTHHLSILALRANLERLDEHQFTELDEGPSQQKPINCGVTIYRGMPDEGQDGHLVLTDYNRRLYGPD